MKLNFDKSTSANNPDADENDTIAGLKGWHIEFVIEWDQMQIFWWNIICKFFHSDDGENLIKFHKGISRFELYPEDSEVVDEVLYDMATRPITRIGKHLGYQF